MAFGVFIHRADSVYDDLPAEKYQFPAIYLKRAAQFEGDWIVYYEPTKVRNSRGYFAIARVSKIVSDPSAEGMYLALIEPGSYWEFPNSVPFADANGVVESGVLNDAGRISGRAQSAVRPMSKSDFDAIRERGLWGVGDELPRNDGDYASVDENEFAEVYQAPFAGEFDREQVIVSGKKWRRDKIFRQLILKAYDKRCAITGMKLINGGGRAEVQAAHIRSVDQKGPDSVNNGMALSGTVHWMFDRGLIAVEDDLSIVISRHVNDRDSVEGLINRTGRLVGPALGRDRPHPAYLAWHREHRFKC
ncbi:HNH endonuclease [Devosia sp. MC532]|uniref:HNH endonuclease n=1 Tax=Devosia sp. MC532 TaxID=2799788 RepID=UPI0018F70BF7|nr:HNH endonuclease [Devosia sp. MC532]MBJ7577437.1 HNH endonuclease [Devosia sp. MC532]